MFYRASVNGTFALFVHIGPIYHDLYHGFKLVFYVLKTA